MQKWWNKHVEQIEIEIAIGANINIHLVKYNSQSCLGPRHKQTHPGE